MNACKEVLQTETAYVEDLNTIIFIFKGPMESLVDEQALSHIFSNIEDLSHLAHALDPVKWPTRSSKLTLLSTEYLHLQKPEEERCSA